MLVHLENVLPNILAMLYVVNILISFTIIFLERKNPSTTLAWILILATIPVAGIFLYILFSQNLARRKMFKLTRREEEDFKSSIDKQMRTMDRGEYVFSTKAAIGWADTIRLNQVYGGAYFTQDNSIEIITDGSEMIDMLLKDIENARESVNLEYYIIKNDAVGKSVIEALIKKAKEGITVRLLLDALGSRSIFEKSKQIKRLKKAGGKVCFFFPPKLKIINLRINYRNHRKLVVIDGEIGYIGGFNIGKEYVGLKKRFGYWRDTHLRIVGNSVKDIYARFLLDWRFASEEKVTMTEAYFSKDIGKGKTGIQIVSSGPDEYKMQIQRGYMKLITNAKRNIYIQTPYFVPDQSILESLKMAAQSGVDVKIMIPNAPDHIFVYWATFAYVGELIRSGATVYIYDKGFLHGKTMVVDGQVISIGSANFDMRSFKLNFETNAFIFDEDEGIKMEKLFEEDMKHSYEMTMEMYAQRGAGIKFKESISRLLSELL